MRFVTNKAGEVGDFSQLAMKGPIIRLPRRDCKLLLKHLRLPSWRDVEAPPEIKALMARLVDVPNIPYFEVILKRYERHDNQG